MILVTVFTTHTGRKDMEAEMDSPTDWIRKQRLKTVTAEVAETNIASNALLKKFHFKVIKNTSFKKYNMDISYEGHL